MKPNLKLHINTKICHNSKKTKIRNILIKTNKHQKNKVLDQVC